MNHKEIFDAAKNNNIRNLLRAKKEIRQVHSARNLTETMYLNDFAEIERILYRAAQVIESMLEDIRDNLGARGKAYFLLGRNYISYADDLRNDSLLGEKCGWGEMMCRAFSERYFNMESVTIEGLYDKAKIHRIRTIILEGGMENLFAKMSMEAKKIRLDTANISFLSDMLLGIEDGKDEGLEPIKTIIAECLRNRLWVNEGVINQRYFDRVREINNVINKYYGRETME